MGGPVGWHGRLKIAIARTLGLDDATLHVHLGLAIYLLLALVSDGGLASPWPVAILLVIELANEGFDRLRTGSWRWRDTVQDVVNTMVWPVVLTLLARADLL